MAQPNWTTSINEARLLAQKEHKHIFIMLSKENCDGCWYMEHIVFEDEGVQKLLYENFVPVYIDVDQDTIPSTFKFVGTPTFYFLNEDGEKIGFRLSGVKNVKEFTSRLLKVLKQH